MDFIISILDIFLTHFIVPIVETFYELFSVEARQTIIFIFIAYVVAFFVFLHRRDRGLIKDKSFGGFVGGRAVFLHPSALMDYQYYFIRAVLGSVFVAPLIAVIFLPEYISGEMLAPVFEGWFGAVENAWELNVRTAMIIGFFMFILMDFSHYWVHRIFHTSFLWEFHKVHHSAEVLVPQTANRVHFIESLFEKLLYFSLAGVVFGYFYYLCDGEAGVYEVLGVLYLSLIFNALAANLRHSHVWLSFGPVIERVINSPAQHHIHHSNNPKHYDKNFGTNLSVWDWMFGTLYTTSRDPENIEFGLTPVEHAEYKGLKDLIIRPFIACYYLLYKKDGDV